MEINYTPQQPQQPPATQEPDPTPSLPSRFAFFAALGFIVGGVALLAILKYWTRGVGWFQNFLGWDNVFLIPVALAAVFMGAYAGLLTIQAARGRFGFIFGDEETESGPVEIVEKDSGKGARIHLACFLFATDYYIFGDKVTRSATDRAFFTEANEIMKNPLIGLRVGTGRGQKFAEGLGMDEIFGALALVSVNEEGTRYAIKTEGGQKIFAFSGKEQKGTDVPSGGRIPKKEKKNPSPTKKGSVDGSENSKKPITETEITENQRS